MTGRRRFGYFVILYALLVMVFSALQAQAAVNPGIQDSVQIIPVDIGDKVLVSNMARGCRDVCAFDQIIYITFYDFDGEEWEGASFSVHVLARGHTMFKAAQPGSFVIRSYAKVTVGVRD